MWNINTWLGPSARERLKRRHVAHSSNYVNQLWIVTFFLLSLRLSSFKKISFDDDWIEIKSEIFFSLKANFAINSSNKNYELAFNLAL